MRASDSRYPTRDELLKEGATFYFDGAPDLDAGMWKVRQIVGDDKYRCVRLTGSGQNVENFDIGYVIKQYMEAADNRRGLGMGTVFEAKTRAQRRK